MDQNRPGIPIADILQHWQQVIEVMPIDRPDIIEAEFFEHRAAGPETAAEFLGLAGLVIQEFRQFLRQLLGDFAQ